MDQLFYWLRTRLLFISFQLALYLVLESEAIELVEYIFRPLSTFVPGDTMANNYCVQDSDIHQLIRYQKSSALVYTGNVEFIHNTAKLSLFVRTFKILSYQFCQLKYQESSK